jgi:uncharacterized protein (UPF0305 family)
MKSMEFKKRYALTTSLIYERSASAIDDLVEMFIKKMMNIHKNAKQELERYQLNSIKKLDELISKLRDIVSAYKADGTAEQRLSAIEAVLGNDTEEVLINCEAHLATLSNTNQPFMWKYYKTYRRAFINIIKNIKIHSTNQNISLEKSIEYIINNEISHKDYIDIVRIKNKGKENEQNIQLLDITWVPDSWWKFVTGQSKRTTYPDKINRRNFEVCLFSQIML